jgi:EEF1A lysine methyltransferase 4
MTAKPPAYDTAEYWDTKYRNRERPFEWLFPPEILQAQLLATVKQSEERNPKILHIGSGTSLLPFVLQDVIGHQASIYNVDFSKEAIDWGIEAENRYAMLESGPNQTNVITRDRSKPMKWIQASLLSLDSLQSSMQSADYSIILDKSTSDSISCGVDLAVNLPYPLTVKSSNNLVTRDRRESANSVSSIHPLHLMALNLAFLAKPGAVWIALSYSEFRFDILFSDIEEDEGGFLPADLINQGLPDPRVLWKLESTTAIDCIEEQVKEEQPVYLPKSRHYQFTLRRTEIELVLLSKHEISSEQALQ